MEQEYKGRMPKEIKGRSESKLLKEKIPLYSPEYLVVRWGFAELLVTGLPFDSAAN